MKKEMKFGSTSTGRTGTTARAHELMDNKTRAQCSFVGWDEHENDWMLFPRIEQEKNFSVPSYIKKRKIRIKLPTLSSDGHSVFGFLPFP
jgi:hypothetical protein